APFAIYHFQQFTVYATLGNLLAVPVLSFVVMPAIIMAFLLLPFGAEGPALWVMERGISAIVKIAHDVAALPQAQIVVPTWPLAALVCVTGAALVFMLWAGRGRGIAAIILLAVAA